MTSKDLRAQRAKLISDARAMVSGATVTAEESAKFEVMMAEADGLKVRIDHIERADRADIGKACADHGAEAVLRGRQHAAE